MGEFGSVSAEPGADVQEATDVTKVSVGIGDIVARPMAIFFLWHWILNVETRLACHEDID